MTVRVRFRREAEADVIDALAWYRESGLKLGEEFLRAPKVIRSSIAISDGRS
jgi:hypothetical protein